MALGALVLLGVVALVRQWVLGLGVTGMNRPVYWGIYITNFVFFIGISHAGTLISAILRVTQAEWRRPITRIAEAITLRPDPGRAADLDRPGPPGADRLPVHLGPLPVAAAVGRHLHQRLHARAAPSTCTCR